RRCGARADGVRRRGRRRSARGARRRTHSFPPSSLLHSARRVHYDVHMRELILHHYDISPYAEKIRAILGFKRLAWRSAQIPIVMPKPDLTALTGGYRLTPVLQVGADVSCETRVTARRLEQERPAATPMPCGIEARDLVGPAGGWAMFAPLNTLGVPHHAYP